MTIQMKNILWLIVVFISFQRIQAQDEISIDPIFEIKDVDVKPDFPGGINVLYDFIEKNYIKPSVPELIGKIFLSFIVEKNGALTEITTLKDIGFETGSEAERVLKLSPKWTPGKKDGKIVRVKYILPIGIHTDKP